MVHALQQTYRILQPNGLLINIHDLPAPHVIEVLSAGTVHKIGWLRDSEDFENEISALNALARVVEDGYFDLEDERDFGYKIYVDDLTELQEYLLEFWETAILPDGIIQRLEERIQEAGPSTNIVLALQARMAKLRARG
jgi:phosphoglycerate-specific signal transduction histidine kinase